MAGRRRSARRPTGAVAFAEQRGLPRNAPGGGSRLAPGKARRRVRGLPAARAAVSAGPGAAAIPVRSAAGLLHGRLGSADWLFDALRRNPPGLQPGLLRCRRRRDACRTLRMGRRGPVRQERRPVRRRLRRRPRQPERRMLRRPLLRCRRRMGAGGGESVAIGRRDSRCVPCPPQQGRRRLDELLFGRAGELLADMARGGGERCMGRIYAQRRRD
mmetsp:Transcript_130348/g.377091  ORF Transcript_130348/g.377091 Transcript_130348/m.377091 type:complete len:215 (-) Transcript_130348:1433-2077(-)